MKPDTSGSAFPCRQTVDIPSGKGFPARQVTTDLPGMTHRQWLAGLAMQSLLTMSYRNTPNVCAKAAYDCADAMIKYESEEK